SEAAKSSCTLYAADENPSIEITHDDATNLT
ncbi:hypothetical protein Tco_1149633, partial [Tanacetum coccineum]